jgi:hypothetical protein
MTHRAQAFWALGMARRRFVLEEDFTNAERGSQRLAF